MTLDADLFNDDNWVAKATGAADVKRINLLYFHNLARDLYKILLNRTPDDLSWFDVTTAVVTLRPKLAALVESSDPVPLQTCLPEARALLEWLNEMQEVVQGGSSAINTTQILKTRGLIVQFENTLKTELRDLEVYFVSPVGIFSTSALLATADKMIGEYHHLLPHITVRQMKEAGKCLAFSLPTAAAFHLFAALESVLRAYFDLLSAGAKPPKNPSMGAYLGELSNIPAVDKKLLAALFQVKDLHRNPTVHFENLITPGEALTLIGIIQSAISMTLYVVAQKPPRKPNDAAGGS